MTKETATPKPANDNSRSVRQRVSACPICGKPALPENAPFCSRRCADVDLHRWLGGAYRIPGEASPIDPGDSDE